MPLPEQQRLHDLEHHMRSAQRDVNELEKTVYGSQDDPGLRIRLDRIEQMGVRANAKVLFWTGLGGVILSALVQVVAALIQRL